MNMKHRNSNRSCWYSDQNDLDWLISYHVTNWGCSAQTIGPPERCYPAESAEVEITGVKLCDIALPVDKLADEFLHNATERCLEDAAEVEDDDGADYYRDLAQDDKAMGL